MGWSSAGAHWPTESTRLFSLGTKAERSIRASPPRLPPSISPADLGLSSANGEHSKARRSSPSGSVSPTSDHRGSRW